MNYGSQGNYAKLGVTCCTSMQVLLSNAKFIPPNDPVYKIYYTKTPELPGYTEPENSEEREERGGDMQCCRKG